MLNVDAVRTLRCLLEKQTSTFPFACKILNLFVDSEIYQW
jgi:hypothetical protein